MVTLVLSGYALARTPPEPWRLVIDLFNNSQPTDSNFMPVEGCYVGKGYRELPQLEGFERQEIRNQTQYGMVIRYIRAYRAGGPVDSPRAHKYQIYMLERPDRNGDGRDDGDTLPRGGLAYNAVDGTDTRVSVLRPGEVCSTWLPKPLFDYDGWQIVVSRLEVRGRSNHQDVDDRCIDASGAAVDCAVRIDTTPYGPVELYQSRFVSGSGWTYLDGPTWYSRPL